MLKAYFGQREQAGLRTVHPPITHTYEKKRRVRPFSVLITHTTENKLTLPVYHSILFLSQTEHINIRYIYPGKEQKNPQETTKQSIQTPMYAVGPFGRSTLRAACTASPADGPAGRRRKLSRPETAVAGTVCRCPQPSMNVLRGGQRSSNCAINSRQFRSCRLYCDTATAQASEVKTTPDMTISCTASGLSARA